MHPAARNRLSWLGAGGKLRVDLGELNESISDSWHMIGPPDPAVLAEEDSDYHPDCDQPGCGGPADLSAARTCTGYPAGGLGAGVGATSPTSRAEVNPTGGGLDATSNS
jgi:hypothetical protein